MGLELIVGPPNSGRADEVLARFGGALDRGPVLVVPTSDDVTAFERELCARGGVSLGGTIATFSALAHEVIRSLGASVPPRLTAPRRQALIRAAIRRTRPRLLRRSAATPGFAPALDALIAELQAALVSPDEFERLVSELDRPGHETELAALYRAYVELRDASGSGDDGLALQAAIAALRGEPDDWGDRPVFVYGFDDLTRAQLELIAALAGAGDVLVAVTYEDRRALAVRAPMLAALREELGAVEAPPLPFDAGYTQSETLRHLDQALFEPDPGTVEPDRGLLLLESAGARGEAEAIGIEIARLLQDGYEPDQIAIVVRSPEAGGPLLATVLRDLGIPVALEADVPLASTAVGGSLIALCRAAGDATAVDALLAHMRLDPTLAPGVVDAAERRVRRGDAQTVAEVAAGLKYPPRHLARLQEAGDPARRLRALARSARELAERPHRGEAPLAQRAGAVDGPPFSALELRAGVAAAELLEELARAGDLPGCDPVDLDGVREALESASVAAWRGPAAGRVRIISPYRARAARVRALFLASLQDGEFPRAGGQDPLLSEERRREIGNPDLRRADQAAQERYLFFACVTRPTERLYLSWQNCDEDGAALGRSPFLDEVSDLLASPAERRVRGPERAVPVPEEATSERSLARALAAGGWNLDREAVLDRLGVRGPPRATTLALFEGLPDPCQLPGPLRSPAVLADLGERQVFSANSLEGWVECSYRWFVSHELRPQRLEPEADPLWLGGVVHRALELLYREAPGDDSVPRPRDLRRWQRRFGELLEQEAGRKAPLNRSRRAALDRVRVQVEAFLDSESESETAFRPDPELLELAFGPMDDLDGDDAAPRDALQLGDISLRGRIDRIDVAPDGHSVIVRDYKTGKTVPRADEFGERGKLQIQLYMRLAERVLGLDPVAGLYQPLGAVKPADRKARGIALRDDERLAGIEIVRTDRRDADELREALDDAEATAVRAAGEMQRGLIDRRPIGGQCPKYCTFQPICRLERALGAVGEQNGGREQRG